MYFLGLLMLGVVAFGLNSGPLNKFTVLFQVRVLGCLIHALLTPRWVEKGYPFLGHY